MNNFGDFLRPAVPQDLLQKKFGWTHYSIYCSIIFGKKKKKEIQQASLEIKGSITKNQRLKDMTKQAPKPMGDQNLLKRFLSRY